jgi:hypothetical protein
VGGDTISRITDKVVEEMIQWCHRPLEVVLSGGVHRRDRGEGT